MGVVFGNEDFQSVIKRSVKKGQYFKAYPTCFSHVNVRTIMNRLMATPVAEEIMLTQGVSTSHAIRTKIFLYPEGVMSVWIIIAVLAEKN
jgi:centrosomal protein CEP76